MTKYDYVDSMDINPTALTVIRERSGLSQVDLAKLSGLTQSYISLLEAGKKRPSPKAVISITNALGIPIAAIAASAGEPAA